MKHKLFLIFLQKRYYVNYPQWKVNRQRKPDGGGGREQRGDGGARLRRRSQGERVRERGEQQRL